MKLKQIEVHAKEWFCKSAGNSYFSARVILNSDFDDRKTLLVPFQYGYGDYYLTAAKETLIKAGFDIDDHTPLWLFAKENGIFFRYAKYDNCTKSETIVFGQD